MSNSDAQLEHEMSEPSNPDQAVERIEQGDMIGITAHYHVNTNNPADSSIDHYEIFTDADKLLITESAADQIEKAIGLDLRNESPVCEADIEIVSNNL